MMSGHWAKHLIIALDNMAYPTMQNVVSELSDQVACFKVGLEAMTAVGAPLLIDMIHQSGAKVFLDGKFNDIPNTVGRAVRAAADLGVDMVNVHASCGPDAMRAAVTNKGRAQLYAVTVLTSLTDDVCRQIFGDQIQAAVLKFATMAAQVGIDGLICSPQEIQWIKQQPTLQHLNIMTPGVRPKWSATNDQARTLTPAEALQAGADYLVIGRPVTQPPIELGTPGQALTRLLQELSDELL